MEFEPNFSPQKDKKENDNQIEKERAETLENDPRIEEIESSEFPSNIKMNLILTIAGEKPVFYEPAFIDYSDSEDENEEKRRMINKRKDKAVSLLEKLDMPFEVNKSKISNEVEEGELYEIIGGRNEEDLEKFKEIHNSKETDLEELGKMFGFPETAAKAYSKGQKYLIDRNKAHKLLEKEEKGLSGFANFRLSKNNFEEEVEFLKERKKIIKEASPKIYKEIIEKAKK